VNSEIVVDGDSVREARVSACWMRMMMSEGQRERRLKKVVESEKRG